MGVQYVIWDWNGTLLDDAQLCVDVMNRMLGKRGLPLLDLARYREIFTFPVEKYYRAAGLDLEKEGFAQLAEEYIRPYNREALGCGLCPGAREALEGLKAQGVKQLIASASHQEALEEQVESLGIGGYFEDLLGIRDIFGGGKAGLAKAYLEGRGIGPSRAWCVGDTLHDWEVAQAMGCPCALVAQGHQSARRLSQAGVPVLETPAQLLGLYSQMA